MSWLRHTAPEAPVRLFCLPHAGAGAASFARWTGLVPPGVSLVRVQLPGREDAIGQPPLRRVDNAVDGLLPQVLELADRPFALYGHSMGALLAFELARGLTGRGAPPVHLFVSGRRAPSRAAGKPPIHHLPDDAFRTALAARGGGRLGADDMPPAFLRYATRLTKADLELSEEYVYRPGPPLPCPVTVFHGSGDPIVGLPEVRGWAAETTGPFAIRTFPGDHFFHQDHRAALAAAMTGALGVSGGRVAARRPA